MGKQREMGESVRKGIGDSGPSKYAEGLRGKGGQWTSLGQCGLRDMEKQGDEYSSLKCFLYCAFPGCNPSSALPSPNDCKHSEQVYRMTAAMW